MKKIIRYIADNWTWITIGCVAQKLTIDYAYMFRGYKAFGGEWLVLPVIILTVEAAKCMLRSIAFVMEEDDYESGTMGNRRRTEKK